MENRIHFIKNHRAVHTGANREFIVIVPEQFTMQTQRELVELHPNRGILNIDVQSFLRLAWRIFEEVGVDTHTVLEDTGKNLLAAACGIPSEK